MNTFNSTRSKLAFLIAVVVLSVSAVGLNAAEQFLRLHFRKQPVPLARPLEAIPPQLGHWRQVSKDEPLGHDLLETLGTDQYLFRDFVDERIVGAERLGQLVSAAAADRRRLLAEVQREHPEAVISLGLTYYTGMVDTVAHIPDRCIIADGYQPTEYEVVSWPAGEESIEVRFVNFQDQTGYSRIDRSVAYFFHVNGHWESDPLAVRKRLQNLFEKHGYYAKVELQTFVPDRQASAKVITDFLSRILPEVRKSLPDWQRVTAGGSVNGRPPDKRSEISKGQLHGT